MKNGSDNGEEKSNYNNGTDKNTNKNMIIYTHKKQQMQLEEQ